MTFRLDEREDIRRDAESGGRERRVPLHRSIDPEQLGLCAGDPQDERLAARDDLEVVVRDATAEPLHPVGTVRPDAGDDVCEPRVVDHIRIRSPLGSHSGSAATSPAIQSPKISTSTAWPTAERLAGRYA